MVTEAFVAPQQQAADAVERIPLATTMAALVLLDPATDIVDGHVGQADGVEGIDDEGGVGQLGGHPVGIAPVGIDGHGVHPGQPGFGAVGQPTLDHRGAATSDDVEQPPGHDVDEARHERGVAGGVGPQPRGLVQAQPAHGADAAGVIDQWPAVVAHRLHHCGPADAQGATDLGHGVVVLAHPPAGLDPGPLGERRPGADEWARLAPGLHLAVGLSTAPQPLGPHHDHGPAAAGQVTHLGPAPALGPRSGSTAETADDAGLGLHQLVQLAVDLDRRQQDEALQAQNRDCTVATLESHQGPPRFSVA